LEIAVVFRKAATIIGLSIWVLGAKCSAQSRVNTEAPASAKTATDPGAEILEKKCTACHSSSRYMVQAKSRDEWNTTVRKMIDLGADISPGDDKIIVDYLVSNSHARELNK
jgi:cytochrome c5